MQMCGGFRWREGVYRQNYFNIYHTWGCAYGVTSSAERWSAGITTLENGLRSYAASATSRNQLKVKILASLVRRRVCSTLIARVAASCFATNSEVLYQEQGSRTSRRNLGVVLPTCYAGEAEFQRILRISPVIRVYVFPARVSCASPRFHFAFLTPWSNHVCLLGVISSRTPHAPVALLVCCSRHCCPLVQHAEDLPQQFYVGERTGFAEHRAGMSNSSRPPSERDLIRWRQGLRCKADVLNERKWG